MANPKFNAAAGCWTGEGARLSIRVVVVLRGAETQQRAPGKEAERRLPSRGAARHQPQGEAAAPAGVSFPLAGLQPEPGWAGRVVLWGPASSSPLFLPLPPPGAVPGGAANERREEGSGKRSAHGVAALLCAGGRSAKAKFALSESWCPFQSRATPPGPPQRDDSAALGAVTQPQPDRRTLGSGARAGEAAC